MVDLSVENLNRLFNEFLTREKERKREAMANANANGQAPATTVQNLDVVHEGSRIVLPIINEKPMSYDEGIVWLGRFKEEENRKVQPLHTLECSPLDGLVAFHRALATKYGWTGLIPTPPPNFFSREQPPMMVGVPISATETMQVPYGRLQIPGITGHLETSLQPYPKPAFVLTGEVRRKNETEVNEIFALTREFLRTQSIYKGKAVRINFDYLKRAKPIYDFFADAPQYMNLDPEMEKTLIFGEKVQRDLEIGLFTPIEFSKACREYQVPLKRGILLHGRYGTGKTLTANVTAIKAERNGWTFIYLSDVKHLALALQFAAQYAPAIVFAEDIDRVVTGERSTKMDEILNILDGVDTKNGEIITVFTTNHIENINSAVLRMGRLDTLVEVLPPDANAAARLVSLYARGLLEPSASLEKVGDRLSGKIPAFIRETVERAKIAAISRTAGGDIIGHVLEKDLLDAAGALETHEAFLKPKGGEVVVAKEIFVKVSTSKSENALDLLEHIEEDGLDAVIESQAAPSGLEHVSTQ